MSDPEPDEPSETSERDKNQRTVARGALVNLFGMVGKLFLPIFVIVITRLFGPDTVGLYMLAFILLDVAANLTVSGITDGVLMFATREDVAKREDGFYQILANGFAISVGVSALLIGASWIGGPWLLERLYENGAELAPLVQIMALALPFRVICIVVIAATKVKLTMKWDALLNGFGRSVLLLVASVVAFFFDDSATALAWAYLVAWASIGIISLLVLPQYYRYGLLLHALRHFRLSMPLIRFAIPQNLNMAFGRFATDIDTMMLAYFGVPPADLLFYWMGGQVVRNVRQIKLIFSGAYAPIIVRLHVQGDQEGMNLSFSMVSRWAMTLAIPAALTITFFRRELALLFHDTFTDDTSFMLLLLVPPLLSCGVGLASNIIVMTGHSKWNLTNSLVMAALNMGLNYLLIPHYGYFGAALATVLASIFVTCMTLIEARVLVGAALVLSEVYKPLLAGLTGAAIATAWLLIEPTGSVAMRGVGCLAALGGYFFVLVSLGVAQADVEALLPWKRRAA